MQGEIFEDIVRRLDAIHGSGRYELPPGAALRNDDLYFVAGADIAGRIQDSFFKGNPFDIMGYLYDIQALFATYSRTGERKGYDYSTNANLNRLEEGVAISTSFLGQTTFKLENEVLVAERSVEPQVAEPHVLLGYLKERDTFVQSVGAILKNPDRAEEMAKHLYQEQVALL